MKKGIKGIEMAMKLAVVIVVVLIGDEALGEKQPDPACTAAITTMLPCLGFVTGKEATPPAACCTALAGVLQSQPKCLCDILNGGGLVPVNKTLAIQLPLLCKLKAPPASDCDKVSGNGTAKPPSPISTPAAAPTPLPHPDHSHNEAGSPSPAAKSGGNTMIVNLRLIANFLLIIATAVASF